MFEDKLKKIKLWTWAFLLIDVVIIVGALITFFHSTHIKALILCAMVVVVVYDSTVLIKPWYRVYHNEIKVRTEVKRLQLQVAELVGRNEPSAN